MFAKAYTLVKESGLKFVREKATRLGAAIAFYSALSLAPLLLVVIGVASSVFGEQAIQGQVKGHLVDLMGERSAAAVEDMLAANQHKSGDAGLATGAVLGGASQATPAGRPKSWKNTVFTAVGLVSLVFASTSLFAQLQDAINTIWRTDKEQSPAEEEPTTYLQDAWEFVRDRLLSLSVIAGMAFLLLVSTIFGAMVTALSSQLDAVVPAGGTWLRLANVAVSLLLTATMFAMIFKILPKARVSWSDVWIGAAATAVLFNIGKFLLSYYFGTASVGSSYGAAGSVVVLLLWVYYSTQILLFGACFTFVYASKFGSGVRTGSGKVVRDEAPAPSPKSA